MDPIQTAFSPPERNSEAMQSFGFRMRNLFSAYEAYRRPQELIWIESLRQYKGLYDPSVRIDPNASKVYPKLTRSKINIVLSRLMEMLFPETDRNWEIEPTPEPKVSQETVLTIAKQLMAAQEMVDETGQPAPVQLPTPQQLKIAIINYVKERCKSMSITIDDQLEEMDYKGIVKKIVRSGLLYGLGIAKGVLISKRRTRNWEPDEMGGYSEKLGNEDIPFFESVRVWDWYPDSSVTELKDGEGSFERHVMTKHDLRQLMRRKDFYSDIISQYLKDHPDGDYVPKNWEVDLQNVEVEAGSGKAHSTSTTATNPSGSYDTNGSSFRPNGKRYEVLEYWGYIDGTDLEACGIHVDDVELEYGANVWILGNKPIKATLFDGALDKYKTFYYEKDETSIWGEGLARVMRHSQLAVAGGARMVLDNGSICSGPQLEVNWSLMTPNTDVTDMYPRKIWYREGKGIDAQYPALRSYNIESHIQELIQVIDLFKEFGDEETTLPTWMIGQVSTNETAQGFSGRMSQILASIKDVVRNFDDFTENIIKDLYEWNMEFNPNSDIKGDYNVKARGSSSLVQREVRMQAMTQLRATLQPEDWMYIPRLEFLRAIIEDHDLRIKLRTEEEAQEYAASQRDERAIELAYAQQEAEVAYKKAQAVEKSVKAKKTNVEATKDAQTPIEQPQGDPRLNDMELNLKETDRLAKEAEIRRNEEKHALDMQHQDEKHKVSMAMESASKLSDIDNKNKVTEHGMKIKEETAKQTMKQTAMAAKEKAKQDKINKQSKPTKPTNKPTNQSKE